MRYQAKDEYYSERDALTEKSGKVKRMLKDGKAPKEINGRYTWASPEFIRAAQLSNVLSGAKSAGPEDTKAVDECIACMKYFLDGYSNTYVSKATALPIRTVTVARKALAMAGVPVLDEEITEESASEELVKSIGDGFRSGETTKTVKDRTGASTALVNKVRKNIDKSEIKYCPKISNGSGSKEHICWECRHAVPHRDKQTGKIYGCMWSVNLRPVEGWTADEVKPGHYCVKECPMFEHD